MNKYSEWTDEQVNIEVHKRYKNECFYNEGKQVARVDYCNDGGAAWPIIKKNEIEITWAYSVNAAVALDSENRAGFIVAEFEDKSRALRAAMEVFLMMSEGE